MSDRPWLLKPGEAHDCKGVPIYPGDLLRTPHFRDRRRKQHYLYHTIALQKVRGTTALWMIPTSHLEPTKRNGGGSCLLSQELAGSCEVISGHGPGECLDYTDRKKIRPKAAGGDDE